MSRQRSSRTASPPSTTSFSLRPRPRVSDPSRERVLPGSESSPAYAQDITPQTLVELLGMNVNILFALGTKQTMLTSLASEFSLILPPPGTPLISHFPHRGEPATVVPIVPRAHPALPSTAGGAPVWFAGAPHALGPNPLLVPLLRAPPESFASDAESDGGADALVDAAERGGEGLWAGAQLSVVTGFQARSGARAAWVGGVRMFADEFMSKTSAAGGASGNAAFARDLLAWTFQESLVLRIDDVTHHRVGETEPGETYTTSDEIVSLRAFVTGVPR
jgi:oligosaccharyltransferase complex subunit beta